MRVKTTFKRYEIKFALTREQKTALLEAMRPYMRLDEYKRTTIRNIYYDTDSYRIVRRSNEKPIYKEKLRVRSYSKASPESTVFVELKKKYDSVVYKRRAAMPENRAASWLSGKKIPENRSQIEEEIEYFRTFYKGIKPKMFISYEREAYYDINGSDLRITLDENILARTERLSLCEEAGGIPVLDTGLTLAEFKSSGALPLWLVDFLTKNKIYKTSFSKYGAAYEQLIINEKGELRYVG